MAQLKLGLVGCGGFGNFHLTNLLKMDDVAVTALYSRNPQRLEGTLGRVPSAHPYTDYRKMLEAEPLDALLISVTPDGHGDLELLAADRRLPFYVEKPVGLALDEVSRVAAAVEKAGILTSVGYQDRYSPVYEEIRRAIAGKTVGLVFGSWIDCMPGAPWWRLKASSGGQMIEQTTHIFDALRYLFGEVRQVFAWGNNSLHSGVPDCDVEDCSSVLLQFEDGKIGTVSSGCYMKWQRGTRAVGLTIHAEDVKIEYDWGASLRLISARETREIRYTEGFHAAAVSAFLQAVRTGDGCGIRSTYQDGAQTLALTLAANRSLGSGQPESVPSFRR